MTSRSQIRCLFDTVERNDSVSVTSVMTKKPFPSSLFRNPFSAENTRRSSLDRLCQCRRTATWSGSTISCT